MRGPLACGDDFLEHSVSGIIGSGNREENFVLRIIKLSEAEEIGFEILFHAFYRADQRDAGRIGAGPQGGMFPSHF